LGVGDIDDDYDSSDEEKEDNIAQIRVPPNHSKLGAGSNYFSGVPAHSMPMMPGAFTGEYPGGSYLGGQNLSRPSSRPVSRPSSFHHGRQEVQHVRVGDVFDISKLSQEEQLHLTLKLSEQESKYGVNMLDELKTIDPSEIATLKSYGYNLGQAVEMIFNEHHDSNKEVIHGSGDLTLVVEADGSHKYSAVLEPQNVPYQASVKRTSSRISAEQQLEPYDQVLSPDSRSPHGPAAYMDSFHKPNSLKSRRHSGIIHHIEEKLGHDLDISYHPDQENEIEHKAQEPAHAHSKSFMDNFHKPNSLKDRRHSGILHVIETKNDSESSCTDVEHKAEISSSFSFANGLHQNTAARATSRNANTPLSRDNSISEELVGSPPQTPNNAHHKDIMERRQSMRTPPPPDAIHHVNLLDRKQSGIRAHQIRQGSMTSEDQRSSSGPFEMPLEYENTRSERRKSSGTPPPPDAIKQINLLDRKGSGILYSRSRSNSIENSESQPIAPSPMKKSVSSPINLVEEMLDPSQLSEEEQLALSIKLSEQDALYGTNMLEELRQIDPAEIETLESFGYDFGQAVEMIFKEHHDLTQDVVHTKDELVEVISPDEGHLMASISHHSSTKIENNPLRRRPSKVDLLESNNEVAGLSSPTLQPVPIVGQSYRNADELLIQESYQYEHRDLHGNSHHNESFHNREPYMHHSELHQSAGSNFELNNQQHLRGRSLHSDVIDPPQEFHEHNTSSQDLRLGSNSRQDSGRRRSTSRVEVLNPEYPNNPSSDQYPNNIANRRTPTQLSDHQDSSSFQNLDRTHRHQGIMNMHHNADRGHNPQLYSFEHNDDFQPQHDPYRHVDARMQGSSRNSIPTMPQHQHAFTDDYSYQHAPPAPQQPQFQQPLPPTIDRKLSSSNQSFYEADPRNGLNTRSHSSSIHEERLSGRVPMIVPERGFNDNIYGDHNRTTQNPDYYQQQQYHQPQQPPKTLTHRSSAHNMIPVRVESYADIPTNDFGPPSNQSHQAIYRSSSQEHLYSQRFYDQPRSSTSNQYSPPAPFQQQQQQQHNMNDSYLYPSPGHVSSHHQHHMYQQAPQQYSPPPQQHCYRGGGPSTHPRGSLSQPPSNIIEAMRAEALSRLPEDQQIRLSMLVSKQEEMHGMNMFDSLQAHDQPEIDYWLSLGYVFDKVALFMFTRRFDCRITRPDR
jgi:hypothetical protein